MLTKRPEITRTRSMPARTNWGKNPLEPPKKIVDQFMKFWYWYITRRDKNSEITFMNYGFSNHIELDLNEKDEFNRYHIQLYDYITGYLDIEGLDVLEVGSGRGGGAEYITRSFKPRSYKGVDLNKSAVKFCNKFYSLKGLSFTHGNALNLPFENNSFDVVINVESSHRYPNVDKFLKEIHRVLRPRGYFLFTDFRDDYLIDRLHHQLRNSKMEIKKREFITPYVVKALELDHDRKETLIKRLSPPVFRPIARDFSGIKGTRMYRWFKAGKVEYLYYVMQK
ncbi:MAG: methyltransferase domain-containing protein [Candidatus Aminicenantes bacterium]|nr:methyltransferase domain-containing protein [Candidatus Aminicenantes bacterium]NIN22923.1 methyltransferase domain-containing protein [Candidatus Aminicenantes bacterium]